MNEDVFPFLQAVRYTESDSSDLPLYTDVLWDDVNDCAVLGTNGEPILTSGNEALRGWIIRSLKTERYAENFFTRAHGSELKRLIGKAWRVDTRMAEAKRYISDCLLQNRYIVKVDVYFVKFRNNALNIRCSVETVYGSMDLNVEGLNV